MESLGRLLQNARAAKGVTIEEAARATKVRAAQLTDIEAENFSKFPSLGYAKGFLMIYGKYLEVDVRPYLEAFEGSRHVTVDGYSYLQKDTPAPAPLRPIANREPGKPSALPLIIGLVVLVGGFLLVRLILDIQRVAPPRETQTSANHAVAAVSATPAPVATAAPPPAVVAAESTPIAVASAAPSVIPARELPTEPTATPMAATTAAPTALPMLVTANNSPEPEVRRAEPVHPEDLANIATPATPEPVESSGPNRVQVRPLKKTYVKVIVDDDETTPAYDRWLAPSDGPVQFRGKRIAIRVLDRSAVEIKKNGQVVSDPNTNVSIQ